MALQRASQMIEEIQPGWGPAQLAGHFDVLAGLLAAAGASGTTGELLVARLGQRMRETDHKGYPEKVLRKVLRLPGGAKGRPKGKKAPGAGGPGVAASAQYVALSTVADGQLDGQPRCGIFDRAASKHLTNFELFIEEELEVLDEVEPGKDFLGRLVLADRTVSFRIPARRYASNSDLLSELYDAGGSGLRIDCKPHSLRNAIGEISTGCRRRRCITDFGWRDAGETFLVPGGRVTAAGFQPAGPGDDLFVDLSACAPASHLGFKPLAPADLRAVKGHVVEDLLPLHHGPVTRGLLALTAAALLQRFSGSTQRFAGWLQGDSGTGKSLLAKLFVNFYGDYPPQEDGSARFMSWSSTPNAIERAGYYFRDALYLVDDFKTATAQHSQVVRLLQAYGDGAARGRLNADATFNRTRPIRGLLLVTGENLIDHEASAVARTVVLPVGPPPRKDFARRDRCLARCGDYRGLTADFVRWLIACRAPAELAGRVGKLQGFLYRDLAGQPNDSRVAGNLAVLGVCFAYFARNLGDVWPGWRVGVRRFVQEDLLAWRDDLMRTVKEQRPIDVFLQILADLVRHERVQLGARGEGGPPSVGRRAPTCPAAYHVSANLALEAVQRCLREQGRPPLALVPGQIAKQLRAEGKLLDREGRPLAAGGSGAATMPHRIDGRPEHCFLIGEQALLGEPRPPAPRPPGLVYPAQPVAPPCPGPTPRPCPTPPSA
jgi:hypothetical protein